MHLMGVIWPSPFSNTLTLLKLCMHVCAFACVSVHMRSCIMSYLWIFLNFFFIVVLHRPPHPCLPPPTPLPPPLLLPQFISLLQCPSRSLLLDRFCYGSNQLFTSPCPTLQPHPPPSPLLLPQFISLLRCHSRSSLLDRFCYGSDQHGAIWFIGFMVQTSMGAILYIVSSLVSM